jgi:electron transport complex protein RnfC
MKALSIRGRARRGRGLHLQPWPQPAPIAPADAPVPVPIPPRLYLPLDASSGMRLIPRVSAGDRVLRGQPVCHGGQTAPWIIRHAPASGQVVGVLRAEAIPEGQTSVSSVDCLVIAPDGEDHAIPAMQPLTDTLATTPERLRGRILEAGIMGLGGASFPCGAKLAAADSAGVHTLIVNGAECDPYIHCDDSLMRTSPHRVVRGAQLACRAAGANRCLIAVNADMDEAMAAVTRAIADIDPAGTIELQAVPAYYPAGGERQLVQMLLGLEVPSGGLPLDVGVVCQNAATVATVADAVDRGLPVLSRMVSVTGPGVARPGNYVVLMGTPIEYVIAAAGGYHPDVARLVMGGAMTGIALPHDGVPVTMATNALLALTTAQVGDAKPPMPCIRCGDCATVCPAVLQPQELHRQLESGHVRVATDVHGLMDCIECGCCDLVCPSGIALTQTFRAARAVVAAEQAATAQRDHWRALHARHLARTSSNERAAAARASRRATRDEAREAPGEAPPPPPGEGLSLDSAEDSRQAVIEAAVERVKRRRAARKTAGHGTGSSDPHPPGGIVRNDDAV